MTNEVDLIWRRCSWGTVGLSIPALVGAVLLFDSSVQSDSPLSLVGMAIAVLFGLPILVALILAGVSFAVRRRSPGAARVLSVIAISIIGVVALLAFVIFVPGLVG